MAAVDRLTRIRGTVRVLFTEWREIGWVGKAALVGIIASAMIAVALGAWIPSSARRHLLESQTDIMSSVASDFAAEGLFPGGDTDAHVAFDEEVRLRLLGGETVRVKVWSPDGVILYSDAETLVGQAFELTTSASEALAGIPSYNSSDLSDPAHAIDREHGALIEYFIPIKAPDGTVLGAFEVEQQADSLDQTLGHIRRGVRASIGVGLGALTVFMASLTLAGARVANRRRRHAEDLLGQVLGAREEERHQVVGMLHDDIGQALYRLHYRLEGTRSKVGDPDVVEEELANLAELVSEIDGTLRSELRLLHRNEVEDVGVLAAFAELVESNATETELDIDLDIDLDTETSSVVGGALFSAAEEGLINVRKHAGAKSVRVRLWSDPTRANLEIVDDGSGTTGGEGIGLATTRGRLDALGGGLSVKRRRSGGTSLRAWVPLGVEPE